MIKFVPKLLKNKIPFFRFATNKSYQYQINCQLLLKYKQYQPWKSIQLMHAITMIKYQEQMQHIATSTKWKEDDLKIQEVLTFLSGQLHSVPHKEINYLMEILKQRGYTYQRDVPIFKALNKQAKLCFGNQYSGNQLLKSLLMIKYLKFPKNTWVKLIEGFLSISLDDYKQNKRLNVNLNDLFKIGIVILQQPFVPLFLVKKLIQRLTKQTAKTLQCLSSLYHINKILDLCMQKQVQYQYTRNSIKDIMYNSYNIQSQVNKDELSQRQQASQSKQSLSQQYHNQTKKKLLQSKNEINKIFQDSIDVQKLQKQIIKMIQNQQQPITKSIILFTSDIKPLITYVYQYLNQNINKLTPIQFIHLVRKCQSQSAKKYLSQYLKLMGQYMNIQQKVYLYVQINRTFQFQIQPSIIITLLKDINQITYHQFISVMNLVSLLPVHHKHRIAQILAIIQSKVPKQ